MTDSLSLDAPAMTDPTATDATPLPDAASTGWDCHAHLFGPYDRFPLAADRSYTPPEAVEADYLAMLARLGLSHGVLVHPSAYGEDHALLLHALATHPTMRGVMVLRPGMRPTLRGLREQGIRATRFSHRSGSGLNFAGSASFADLQAMAPALADAGLHAELFTDCAALPGIAADLAQLPVPVVIDHMGGFDVGKGIDDPGFRSLLSLVESGKAWVKLCAYRNLQKVADVDAGLPFHRALVEARPDRMVWGSDWPHLRIEPVPDALALLNIFKRWTGDEALVHRLLVRNSDTLYR